MKPFSKILFLVLLTAYSPIAEAQQNLVPNGSFEEYTECPTGYPDLDGKCNGWKMFRGTPDYFHDCSSVCGYDNECGYQGPRTGEAYAGFIMYGVNTNFTEQLGTELFSPLTVGNKYYVSFYVSAGNKDIRNIVANKIGAKFTTYQYHDPNAFSALFNNCQVYTSVIISDTVSWVKISGSFLADSAYRYVVVGAFFEGEYIDTTHLQSTIIPQQAYYYLDDVCVSTDASVCEVEDCNFVLPLAFSPNNDGVNDKYKWVQKCSSVKDFTMRIYNRWGELVFTTNDYTESWNGRYRDEPQPTDVYAVYVSVVSNGKKITKSASITLLR